MTTTLTAPPVAPDPVDGPTTFKAEAAAFVAWFATHVAEVNTLNGELVALATVPVTTQSGTAYTLAIGDQNSAVLFSNGSAVTVTVPPNASAAFATGSFIELHQTGAGTVTVAPGAGVTIQSRGGLLSSAGQHGVLGLRKTATNTWRLFGDIA